MHGVRGRRGEHAEETASEYDSVVIGDGAAGLGDGAAGLAGALVVAREGSLGCGS